MRHFLPGFAVACAAATPAIAQQASAPDQSERLPQATVPEQEANAPDRVTVHLGAAIVSEYISRGISFAEEPSLQASVSANIALPELTGGAITDANLFVGNWNSIKLGAVDSDGTGSLTRFYESDLYAGASIELAHRWTVSATYFRYESLSDSFEGYNDLELIVSFDDAGVWGASGVSGFALSPSLRLVQEAGRPGRSDALYVQPSLTPSFDVGPGAHPVRIAVPLVLGFSDDYFVSDDGDTETFGFFRTGIAASGAPFPEKTPALQMTAGIDVWLLNEDVANGLGGREMVGRVGLNWSF